MGETFRNEEARAAWREQLKQLDARKLIVIDECGSNIGLTPLYARACHPGNEPLEVLHGSRREEHHLDCHINLRGDG